MPPHFFHSYYSWSLGCPLKVPRAHLLVFVVQETHSLQLSDHTHTFIICIDLQVKNVPGKRIDLRGGGNLTEILRKPLFL